MVTKLGFSIGSFHTLKKEEGEDSHAQLVSDTEEDSSIDARHRIEGGQPMTYSAIHQPALSMNDSVIYSNASNAVSRRSWTKIEERY